MLQPKRPPEAGPPVCREPLSPLLLRSLDWCGPAAGEMAALVPAFGHFFLRIPLARLHLMALTLAVRESLPPSQQVPLSELALWLIRRPAREVLARLSVRCPPGVLGCLRKLSFKVLPAPSYLQLLALLEEPRAAKVLWHASKIKPKLIELLLALEPELRQPEFVRFVGKASRLEAIEYLLAGLLRLRAAESRSTLLLSLVHVTSDDGLALWFERWLAKAPFPAPPWEGTPTLYPLQSAQEMKQTALAFGNCLRDHIHHVVLGCRYYYVSTEPLEAVCELVKDPLAGWALNELKGHHDAPLPEMAATALVEVFAAAGFRNPPAQGLLPLQLEFPEWRLAGL